MRPLTLPGVENINKSNFLALLPLKPNPVGREGLSSEDEGFFRSGGSWAAANFVVKARWLFKLYIELSKFTQACTAATSGVQMERRVLLAGINNKNTFLVFSKCFPGWHLLRSLYPVSVKVFDLDNLNHPLFIALPRSHPPLLRLQNTARILPACHCFWMKQSLYVSIGSSSYT